MNSKVPTSPKILINTYFEEFLCMCVCVFKQSVIEIAKNDLKYIQVVLRVIEISLQLYIYTI